MVIWMLTYIVGLGGFAHCVASSCEIFVAVLTHHAAWSAYGGWLAPAVAGNICGGVGLVTILEYGQAVYGKAVEERVTAAESKETGDALTLIGAEDAPEERPNAMEEAFELFGWRFGWGGFG